MNIILLGMGATRHDCPYDAEVWGVNNGYRQVMWHNRDKENSIKELKELRQRTPQSPEDEFNIQQEIEKYTHLITAPIAKLDKLFICHRGQEWDAAGDPIFNFEEINHIAQQGVGIVTLFRVKEIPIYTRYPYHQIAKKFDTDYFSDTIAYMLAYAIHINTRKVGGRLRLKEPLKIRFYGADMHTQDEYATERGGIEYFIGVARTLGADVWIHPASSLCQTTNRLPYGFSKSNKKLLDPHNILELQKSAKGLRKLLRKGVIDEVQFRGMKECLDAAIT